MGLIWSVPMMPLKERECRGCRMDLAISFMGLCVFLLHVWHRPSFGAQSLGSRGLTGPRQDLFPQPPSCLLLQCSKQAGFAPPGWLLRSCFHAECASGGSC